MLQDIDYTGAIRRNLIPALVALVAFMALPSNPVALPAPDAAS